MKQEASSSTENIQDGSLEYSYMDNAVPEHKPEDEDPEEDPEEVPQEDPDESMDSGPKSESLFPIEPLRTEPYLVFNDSLDLPNENEIEEGEEVNQPCTPALAMSIVERDAAKLTNIKGINGVLASYIHYMIDKKNTEFYLRVIIEYIRAIRVRSGPKSKPIRKSYWIWAIELVSSFMNKTRKLRSLRKAMLDYLYVHIK